MTRCFKVAKVLDRVSQIPEYCNEACEIQMCGDSVFEIS